MILSTLSKPECLKSCFDKFFAITKRTRRQDPCENCLPNIFATNLFVIHDSYKNQNGISASFTGRPWVELIATYSPVNLRRIKNIFKSQQIHLTIVSIDVAFKKHI